MKKRTDNIDVKALLKKARFQILVETQKELGEKLGYTRGAPAQWIARNYLPDRAKMRIHKLTGIPFEEMGE